MNLRNIRRSIAAVAALLAGVFFALSAGSVRADDAFTVYNPKNYTQYESTVGENQYTFFDADVENAGEPIRIIASIGKTGDQTVKIWEFTNNGGTRTFSLVPGSSATSDHADGNGVPFIIHYYHDGDSFDAMISGAADARISYMDDRDQQVISREISEPTPRLINQAIRYVDESGNDVAPSVDHDVMTGMFYETARRVVRGYLLTSVPSNADGQMNEAGACGTTRTVRYHGGVGAVVRYTQVDEAGGASADVYYGGIHIVDDMMLSALGRAVVSYKVLGSDTIPLANPFGSQTRTVSYVYRRLGSWKISIPGRSEQTTVYPNDMTDAKKSAARPRIIPYVEGYVARCSNASLARVNGDTHAGYILSAPVDPFQDTVVTYEPVAASHEAGGIKSAADNGGSQAKAAPVASPQSQQKETSNREMTVASPSDLAAKSTEKSDKSVKDNRKTLFGFLPQTGERNSDLCFIGAVVIGFLSVFGLFTLDRHYNLDR